MIQAYPKNVAVLRAYGNFLETIKQDKDAAEFMYAEADSYEEEISKVVYDTKKEYAINSPMPDVQEKYMTFQADDAASEVGKSPSVVGTDKMFDKVPESALDMQSRTSSSGRQHGMFSHW